MATAASALRGSSGHEGAGGVEAARQVDAVVVSDPVVRDGAGAGVDDVQGDIGLDEGGGGCGTDAVRRVVQRLVRRQAATLDGRGAEAVQESGDIMKQGQPRSSAGVWLAGKYRGAECAPATAASALQSHRCARRRGGEARGGATDFGLYS